jgi:hypothetical protein
MSQRVLLSRQIGVRQRTSDSAFPLDRNGSSWESSVSASRIQDPGASAATATRLWRVSVDHVRQTCGLRVRMSRARSQAEGFRPVAQARLLTVSHKEGR